MATCKECLHYEVCKPMGIAMRNSLKSGALTEGVEHKCYIKCFKPTADVAEVKHGKWIKNAPNPEMMKLFHDNGTGQGMGENSIFWTCSCCGNWGTLIQNYCPNCGAKMDSQL